MTCWRSSSTPAPEISDTYPGTSGSTHGDRNEISPATNAAIGKGNDLFRPGTGKLIVPGEKIS